MELSHRQIMNLRSILATALIAFLFICSSLPNFAKESPAMQKIILAAG